MGELIVSLVPLALGIVMSPLAIMALVAVLVSRRARANGVAFLIGWIVAISAALAVSYLVFGSLELHERATPPLWVALVRLLLALVLLVSAVFVYRRGRDRVRKMAAAASVSDVVAAAPQLPGWLRAVDEFTPVRCGLLGLGIFILNPVDLSCAVLAALDVRIADVGGGWLLVVFAVVGVAPIAIPVVYTLVAGAKADPFLERIRTWIAGHTNVLNAALLVLIGAMQLQKALSALVG
ncbi:MFS family permease [Conyzicola lurida]|uniref:MFS family permease n=1 Tax=Conyzicola lurida TaxID=1172621 RepID=A0A841AJT0_9MICO|nr:GAP family protein [Conyzicola lurida]MBB5843467.1 MFS family permease [Conyzicola lurida]